MILEGKVALVTGSTSGIGLAIARAFAAEGAKLMINGFGDKPDIERECEALGAIHDAADMSDPNLRLGTVLGPLLVDRFAIHAIGPISSGDARDARRDARPLWHRLRDHRDRAATPRRRDRRNHRVVMG